MTAFERDQASIPTEALDLRRDALLAADIALLAAMEKLCYLSDLATISRRFGHEMPYRAADLKPALDALREVAGQVRQEQMEGTC